MGCFSSKEKRSSRRHGAGGQRGRGPIVPNSPPRVSQPASGKPHFFGKFIASINISFTISHWGSIFIDLLYFSYKQNHDKASNVIYVLSQKFEFRKATNNNILIMVTKLWAKIDDFMMSNLYVKRLVKMVPGFEQGFVV